MVCGGIAGLSPGRAPAGHRASSRIAGRSERIRTSDPLLPKQVRYQAALHSDTGRCLMRLPGQRNARFWPAHSDGTRTTVTYLCCCAAICAAGRISMLRFTTTVLGPAEYGHVDTDLAGVRARTQPQPSLGEMIEEQGAGRGGVASRTGRNTGRHPVADRRGARRAGRASGALPGRAARAGAGRLDLPAADRQGRPAARRRARA